MGWRLLEMQEDSGAYSVSAHSGLLGTRVSVTSPGRGDSVEGPSFGDKSFVTERQRITSQL